MSETETAFDHVPRNPAGSFVLYLYAAIYRLMRQIHRLSEAGGLEFEAIFERYPFLGDYFQEMRQNMPEQITWSDGGEWWRREIKAWEVSAEAHLPLRALVEDAGLGFESCLAFMIIGLVEEDSRFGTLFAELQEPLAQRRPMLELVGQMMIDEALVGQSDPWTICRPLLDLGVVEAPNRQAPRSEWLLRVPPLLWDAARGEMSAHPASWAEYREPASFPTFDRLIANREIIARLRKLPELIGAGITRLIILRGVQGSNTTEIVGTVASATGRGLVSVDASELNEADEAAFLGALCTMGRAMPMLSYDLAPGETADLPRLTGYDGPVGIYLGMEGGLSSHVTEKGVTLHLKTPNAAEREAFWSRALAGREAEDLQNIAERFHLPGGYIRQVADIAVAHAGLEGHARVTADDVRQASRTLNRQLLDTLADHLDTRGDWSHLVASESTQDKLHELEQRCSYRERLLTHLGPAFGSGANRGVRALFTGASGTGKTLAAKILAAELGMDLYRVDLAAIINKYIGETEKNLHKVLSRAEALDVMLLLDEGDALLGQRTDVKSANDRYANLETNYLLQRLESYQGIVLITTNLVENIDRAFQRRMDVVVPFFAPQAIERLHILELHLPEDARVDHAYLELIAQRCALTGGQIRGAALHAALLALDERTPVGAYHLEQALRSEYRKAGGTFPLEIAAPLRESDGGMGGLVAALSNR